MLVSPKEGFGLRLPTAQGSNSKTEMTKGETTLPGLTHLSPLFLLGQPDGVPTHGSGERTQTIILSPRPGSEAGHA